MFLSYLIILLKGGGNFSSPFFLSNLIKDYVILFKGKLRNKGIYEIKLIVLQFILIVLSSKLFQIKIDDNRNKFK
jgi:hypothetical protein